MRCASPADEPVTNIRWRASPGGAVQAAVVQTRLLLLTSPTSHLDAESVAVARTASGQLLIAIWRSPDRYFLRQRRGMDPGARCSRAYYEGNYSTYLEKKAGGSRCKAARTQPQKQLTEELAWVRSGQGAPGQKQRRACSTTRRWRPRRRRPAKLDFETQVGRA